MPQQVLLEFWSPRDHGCWTLLLSAGAVPDSNGGQHCVMLHDLIRHALPLGTSGGTAPLPEERVIDMAKSITSTRPTAVLDR